ncbi:MAG: DUF2313 domain-containing protein [Ruminococcaceae bacterium]|nr:DUF2313 domain-containing protein [Oscillospiraceae bacterium]
MKSFESMIKKLSPLKIYDLSDGSIVTGELGAFSAGLDILRDFLDEMLREAFVYTAESYGLESLERISGSVRDDLSLDKRRSMLINRLNFDVGDFTLKGLYKMLSALGVDGDIREYPEDGRIAIVMTDKYYNLTERQWLIDQAQQILPAHLLFDLVFSGLEWSKIDENNNTFDTMDSKYKTWNQIDYVM